MITAIKITLTNIDIVTSKSLDVTFYATIFKKTTKTDKAKLLLLKSIKLVQTTRSAKREILKFWV